MDNEIKIRKILSQLDDIKREVEARDAGTRRRVRRGRSSPHSRRVPLSQVQVGLRGE